ncbi:MAG: hypothetical protein AABY95_05650 [Pseudomonadota bacterium]
MSPLKSSWILLGLMQAGCAVQGGWMGAAAEMDYERVLDHRRMVAARNNDDYYEHHRDGKIYVLAEADDLKAFLRHQQVAQTLTVRGAGPRGETLVFAVARPENFKRLGFGAVEMYYGRRPGRERGFYAEVYKNGIYYLFDDWQTLDDFRFKGSFRTLATERAKDGRPVRFSSQDPALKRRFYKLRG